jgi:hypothetical protein
VLERVKGEIEPFIGQKSIGNGITTWFVANKRSGGRSPSFHWAGSALYPSFLRESRRNGPFLSVDWCRKAFWLLIWKDSTQLGWEMAFRATISGLPRHDLAFETFCS